MCLDADFSSVKMASERVSIERMGLGLGTLTLALAWGPRYSGPSMIVVVGRGVGMGGRDGDKIELG
jgi:hypothetical protein